MYCPRCKRQFEAKRSLCLDCGVPLVRSVSADAFKSRATGKAGAVLGARYVLQGLIGKGATARVYLADDVKTKSLVAVKLLATTSTEARARFLDEARTTTTINHPNVVKVLDVGERGDGTPYLVTEVLKGESLGEYLRRDKTLPIELALQLFRQAAAGLAAAHEHGVIHRDVKPDNLFLVGEIGEPYGLKVIDFGLARPRKRSSATSRLVLGTIEYMAPEQVLTDKVDIRSDVYGLGAVMYRAVTGKLPFDATEDVKLLAHQVIVAPPPPRSIVPSLDPRLETIIVSAMRKNPENRYPSMIALRGDLERLLGVKAGDPRGASIVVDPDVYLPRADFSREAARALYKGLGKKAPF